jgi:signal transduction histidine kinase
MQETGMMATSSGVERKRLEAVVETLSAVGRRGETVAEVAHDARNMVTAIGLYCDLLEEPGVLANPFAHYGSELRLVAAASRRLVDKLVAIDSSIHTLHDSRSSVRNGDGPGGRRRGTNRNEWLMGWDPKPSLPVDSLAVELLANHNLLAALAGAGITLTVDVDGGARPVWMTGEDLTRAMVNLVKNATEAMPGGGRIQIELRELPSGSGAIESLLIGVEDNGPGIPGQSLEAIFDSGHTTRGKGAAAAGSWAGGHHGLGLTITRSIVEGAGGRIRAFNLPQGGARFEIELPVRKPGR